MGRRKLLADLVSWLWISKFFVNKCLLFTTYNKRENKYWKYSAWFVHVCLRRIRHRTVLMANFWIHAINASICFVRITD